MIRATPRATASPMGLLVALLVAGCAEAPSPAIGPGGEDSGDRPGEEGPPNAASSPDSAAEPAYRSTGAPDLTGVPDACRLLTRGYAAALLGGGVGSGRSADISGLGNCAYRADTGEQLSVVVQLGRDDRVESTQFAMSFQHCDTRVAARPEGLGVAAALYERPSEPCGGGLTLWVATGLRFEGRTHPDLTRPVTGRVHLLLSRSPAADPSEALSVLRAGAERVLTRLTE